MSSFDIFLIPGHFVLGQVLKFLQLSSTEFEPSFLSVFSGLISWVFWMAAIRGVWSITLKIFGFQPGRGRF